MGEPQLLTLFVDEITDGLARLLRGEQALSVPVALLPAGAREGDWIELSVRVIPPPSTDTAERRQRLKADDPGGSIEL